jgi:hypothetical protein
VVGESLDLVADVTFSAVDVSQFQDAAFDSEFRAEFVKSVATAAAVPAYRVAITDIAAGSVVVSFVVRFPLGAQSTQDAFVGVLTTDVQAVFSSSSMLGSYGAVEAVIFASHPPPPPPPFPPPLSPPSTPSPPQLRAPPPRPPAPSPFVPSLTVPAPPAATADDSSVGGVPDLFGLGGEFFIGVVGMVALGVVVALIFVLHRKLRPAQTLPSSVDSPELVHSMQVAPEPHAIHPSVPSDHVQSAPAVRTNTPVESVDALDLEYL